MIITHIPPGMFEKHRSKYWFYPEKNNEFHNLLLKHADVIGSFHAGHHHTDSFKVVYGANGKWYVPGVFISVSIFKTFINCNSSQKQDTSSNSYDISLWITIFSKFADWLEI